MAESTTYAAVPRQGWQEVIGLVLVIYAGMNLNGILHYATGLEGFLSPLILVLSLVTIMLCASTRLVSTAYAWFIFFLLAYGIGGLVPLIGDGEVDSERIVAFAGTVIYCTAMYFYIAQRGEDGVRSVLSALQIIFFINCIAVLNDRFIVNYFNIDRPEERASGFFDNPNEAATMALYYIILIASTAKKIDLWTVLKFSVALAALLLTFSKTGMLLFIGLTVMFLCVRRLYGVLAMAVFGAVAMLPVIHFIVSVNPLDMTDEQVLRIEQVLDIFSGEVDNKTTTGRVELWKIGIDRISKTIPLGTGIGTYHRMDGSGYIDLEGNWLGVHNTFLMVLGESGLVPFLIFLGFLFVLIRTALSGMAPVTMVGFVVVFISDMFVGHGVLTTRLHDLMLCIIMAAGLHPRDHQSASRTPNEAMRAT